MWQGVARHLEIGWARSTQDDINILDLDMVSDLELLLIFYKVGKGKNVFTTTVNRCSWKLGSLDGT